ncbi:MAG: hypothetical protein K2H98_09535 [Duncaniella sp.]|nr:hypothetical protein [Duncaniella sp.]
MSEQVFFDNGQISVTSARCILEGKTIPVRSLNAVSMLVETPSRLWPILVIVVGLIVLFCGSWLWGLIVTALGAAWLYFQRNIYYVHIETSSGSSNAYSSTDRGLVEQIVNALNDAIISQAH